MNNSVKRERSRKEKRGRINRHLSQDPVLEEELDSSSFVEPVAEPVEYEAEDDEDDDIRIPRISRFLSDVSDDDHFFDEVFRSWNY